MVEALDGLEGCQASSDRAARERIAALPPAVSQVAAVAALTWEQVEQLTGQVEEATVLLEEYNARLEGELEERRRVGVMLASFLTSQRELLAQAEERVEELQGKMERFQVVREGLDQHINSLPNIPALPSKDSGGARWVLGVRVNRHW